MNGEFFTRTSVLGNAHLGRVGSPSPQGRCRFDRGGRRRSPDSPGDGVVVESIGLSALTRGCAANKCGGG